MIVETSCRVFRAEGICQSGSSYPNDFLYARDAVSSEFEDVSRNKSIFLGVPRTHRAREPRGEELRLGWELGELGDVATQRPAGEVVLEHLLRARFRVAGQVGRFRWRQKRALRVSRARKATTVEPR